MKYLILALVLMGCGEERSDNNVTFDYGMECFDVSNNVSKCENLETVCFYYYQENKLRCKARD